MGVEPDLVRAQDEPGHVVEERIARLDVDPQGSDVRPTRHSRNREQAVVRERSDDAGGQDRSAADIRQDLESLSEELAQQYPARRELAPPDLNCATHQIRLSRKEIVDVAIGDLPRPHVDACRSERAQCRRETFDLIVWFPAAH